MSEHLIWTEKYRPTTIQDTILPKRYKDAFQEMVDTENVPNLILAGPPGIGKTTVAKAMIDELGSSFMLINASLDGNKDTLRNEIRDFATSTSLRGGKKFVILDEADYLSSHMQPALRSFMEEFSKNCGFILTCNFPHKIIEPLHSRCAMIEFKFNNNDKILMLKETFKRLCEVLEKEEVPFDKKVVAEFTKKHFPDIRKMLNELQRYSINGPIDTGLLVDFDETSLKQLVDSMIKKDIDGIRKWVTETDHDQHEVYDKFFRVAEKYVADKNSEAQMIVLLAQYQYQAAFAVNPEINLMAALVEMAVSLEWKQ